MFWALEKLSQIYPDKIVYNISQYHELYYVLAMDAKNKNMSLKEYLRFNGFTYGNDATILKLEDEAEQVLASLNEKRVNATLLNNNQIYNAVNRIADFYGVSIQEYIESLGYQYYRNATNESSIDSECIRILNETFNYTLQEIGSFVGVSRQRIEQVKNSEKVTPVSWITSDFSEVTDIFRYMISNHLFEYVINEKNFKIRHNLNKEICLIWYDDLFIHCSFTEMIPDDLLGLIRDERMDQFFTEDYDFLEEMEIVNRLKQPVIKVTNPKLFAKVKRIHAMNGTEYANLLGYSGYVTDKDVNIDSRFIEFFENNLVDGEVYISSDASNQWIKNFISREAKMSIDKFVELYGYKKASRGKFSTLESYIENEKLKFKEELGKIEENGFVQPQGMLYQRLYIFKNKCGLTMDQLIEELGYKRDIGKARNCAPYNSILIKNELSELDDSIKNALKYQKLYSETEDKYVQTIKRNQELVFRLKKIYGHRCQLCNNDNWMPIQMEEEIFYSEVHHIIPLAEGKDEENTLDRLDNMIVVCPNHHKMLHYHMGGLKKIIQEDNLYFVNAAGVKLPIYTNYHLKAN